MDHRPYLLIAFGLAIMLITVGICSDDSNADSSDITVGGITYHILSEDPAELRLDEVDCIGSVVIPEKVEFNEKEYTVTTIHSNALKKSTQVTSITFPSTVLSLYGDLFSNCKSLTEINVSPDNPKYKSEDGVLLSYDGEKLIRYPCAKSDTQIIIDFSVNRIENSAFSNSVNIKTVCISNYVTYLGNGAFSGCSSLTYINVPKYITDVGTYVFDSCTSLTSVDYYSKDPKLEEGMFMSCTSLKHITIPSYTKIICDQVFSNCTSLEDVIINSNVSSISESAFVNCTSLERISVDSGNNYFTSVDGILYSKDHAVLVKYPVARADKSYTIHSNTVVIYDYAFEYARSITTLSLPDGLTDIGSYSFKDCSLLEKIVIPNKVITIGNDAFENCVSLKYFDVLCGNDYYCSVDGVLFNKEITELISYPSSKSDQHYDVPDTVMRISDHAFCGSMYLNTILISNSVEEISEESFERCTSLKEIQVSSDNNDYASVDGILFNKEISTLVRYPIGKNEETYCVPRSVSQICCHAFYECTSLKYLEVEDGNNAYFSYNGCIYHKWQSTLCACPAGLEEYSSPDGICGIEAFAFSGKIKNIVLNESMLASFRNSFTDCNCLEKITIINKKFSFYDNSIIYDGLGEHIIIVDADQSCVVNKSSVSWNTVIQYSAEFIEVKDIHLDTASMIVIMVLIVVAALTLLICKKSH